MVCEECKIGRGVPINYMRPLVMKVIERFCDRGRGDKIDISYMKSDINDIRFVIENIDLLISIIPCKSCSENKNDDDHLYPDVISFLRKVVSREDKRGDISTIDLKNDINEAECLYRLLSIGLRHLTCSYTEAIENKISWALKSDPLKFWYRYKDIYGNRSRPSKTKRAVSDEG